MNSLQKIQIGLKALRYKLFKVRAPLLVSLSATGRCNLKCPYCYINVYSREPVEPSGEELKKYIDDFYALGTRIFFLQGGEPLMRKDIVEIAGYIKKKGGYVSVSTNGTIHPSIAHLKGIIDHIEFSLDGSPEINDKTRGGGVFAKIMQAAGIAREQGIKFHFHSVLNVHNCEEAQIRFIADLARQHGTFFTACFATSSGYENNQVFTRLVSDEKQKTTYRLLLRMKKEGAPVGMSVYALEHALGWPIPYNVIGDKDNLPTCYKERCLHGRLTAWFDHEGWMYPCTLAFGREGFRENIRELGVKEAWRRLSKIKCIDCGIATDITSIFNLRFESLIDILLKKKY